MAADLGVLPSQLVLAWMLARTSPRVIPLVGTTRVRRYEDAAAALSIELTPGQVTALDAA
jgi:aryl-alcohol dehydrogenase-like predicted oxidoreductase